MMFSLGFAVLLLIVLGVNSQTNDINILRSNNLEKGYPFGKLRPSVDGKTEELIAPTEFEKPQPSNPDQPTGSGQPLPSPCISARPSAKLAYPKDKTKYIQCRDEYHYEVFTCPNGGEFDERTVSCELLIPVPLVPGMDRCEKDKPCLNDGHCISLSNSTFKCNCRSDWTGDRCETPINSCVKKPCGPNAECRTLKTTESEQDYVCVCHGSGGYGLNCREVVSNPCLANEDQFFPYAFSQHAYIQCDGDLIYFQPCGAVLYWNQDEKICDRKRPPKDELPALITKLVANRNNNNQPGKGKENINEEMIPTTTTTTTPIPPVQQNLFVQKGKDELETGNGFIPARVANRQQFQLNMNNQQGLFGQNLRDKEQTTQELPNQLSQSVDFNQPRQDFIPKARQWPHIHTETTGRQPLINQPLRNQPWSHNTKQQSSEASAVDSHISIMNQEPQQQNLLQQNQGFGTQQWLNQVPDQKTQNNQRFVPQVQPFAGSQTVQHQTRFLDPNQQTFVETPVVANTIRLPSIQSSNTLEQEKPWQTRPATSLTANQLSQSSGFKTQNTQNFATQPSSWQNTQSIQNQPQSLTSNIPEGTSFDNKNRLTTGMQSNNQFGLEQQNAQNQQSWQNKGNNINRQNANLPAASLIDVQRLPLTNEQTFTGQSTQNQPWKSTFNSESSTDLNNEQLQKGVQPQVKQEFQQQSLPQSQVFDTQQWLNPVPDIKAQNSQRFVPQQQSWMGSQNVQNQPRLPDQNQQTSTDTATPSLSKVVGLQGFQNQNPQEQDQSWQNKLPNAQVQDQSWQNKLPNSQIQNQPMKSQSNPGLFFQPKPLTDLSKQNQPSSNTDLSSQTQNNQFGLNQQQQQGFQNQLEQKQPWSNNQQLQAQGNQMTDTDEAKMQTTQDLAARPGMSSQSQPWSQTAQLTGNSFETAKPVNKGNPPAFSIHSLRGWQSRQPFEQNQQDNNQIGQQITTDQRKTLESVPTLLSGSWKSQS